MIKKLIMSWFFLTILSLNIYADCQEMDGANSVDNSTVIGALQDIDEDKNICIKGSVKKSSDNKDYYKFRVGTEGTLKIDGSSPNNKKYKLTIGSSKNGSQYYGENNAKNHNMDLITLHKDDIVYIRVRRVNNNKRKYKLNFNFTKNQSKPFSDNTITLTGTLRDFNQDHVDFEPRMDWENNLYGGMFNFFNGVQGGLQTGYVKQQLDNDRKPLPNPSNNHPLKPKKLYEWYHDVNGVNMSMPYSIVLHEIADGVYQFSSNAFFPADGKLFGKENYHGQTGKKYQHNFHMTYELHTKFTYKKGQIFNFVGDDDVWVFINNKLAVDLGGLHSPESGVVNLDTLGLVEGENYNFDFFWAERHTTGSNFTITTSIELDSTPPKPLSPASCDKAPENITSFNSDFDFNKNSSVSGGNGGKGTVARYAHVASLNGQDIDLLVKVKDLKGIKHLYNSGDSTPKGFKFQKISDKDPSVGFFIDSNSDDPKGTKYEATLQMTFVKSGTNTPVTLNFETQVYDIDNFANRTEQVKISKNDYLFFQTSQDTHIKGYEIGDIDIFENKENEDSQNFDKNAMVKFVHKETSSFTIDFVHIKNKDSGHGVGKAGFNLVFGKTEIGLPECKKPQEENATPFTCSTESFVSFNTSENGPTDGESQFDTINLSDGTLKQHNILTGADGVNSIGYNVKDNMIWGYNLAANKIVRIDANHNAKLFDRPSDLPEGFYIAADVDKDGILYLAERNSNEIQRINVDSTSSDFLKVLEPLKLKKSNSYFMNLFGNSATIATADFAFNPKDGQLYFIQEDSNGKVYKIDPQTGLISFVVKSGVDPYVVISFFDKDGNFYFNLGTGNNAKRKLYKIDMNNPHAATYFTDLDKSLTNGDGARCPNAKVDVPTQASLIADYHFDECDWDGTEGEVKDSKGKNDATAYNGVNSVNGVINKAASFTGGKFGEAGVIKVSPDFNLSDEFTISFMLNVDDSNESAGILSKTIDVYVTGDKKLNVVLNNGNSFITKSKLSGWTHVVMTKANGRFKIYLNGQLDSDIPTGYIHNIKNDLVIGGVPSFVFGAGIHLDALGDRAFKGKIDELKFYKGALSSKEVTTLYTNEFVNKLNADGSEREAVICGFTCDDTMYFSNASPLGLSGNEDGKMYLHAIDKSGSPFAFEQIGVGYAHQYNALAYNPKDNFLYAIYKNILLKINKKGKIKEEGKIEGLKEDQNYAAAFDKDGYYYLSDWKDSTNMYKIDITTKKVLKTVTLTQNMEFYDFTFDKSGQYIYTVKIHKNGKVYTNQLVKINKNSGKVTPIGDALTKSGHVDTIYSDAKDRFFLLYNDDGFYEVDPKTGVQKAISNAPKLAYLNDGAMCPNATVNLLPVISFSSNPEVTEGNSEDNNQMLFTIKLNKKTTNPVTFAYATENGNNTNAKLNAKAGDDYTQQHTSEYSITDQIQIGIPVTGDSKVEADEQFKLKLSNIKGALYHDNDIVSTGTIIDDDYNKLTAFDANSDGVSGSQKITTKIVGQPFTLELAEIKDATHYADNFNDLNDTRVGIEDNASCTNDITKVNKNTLVAFTIPNNLHKIDKTFTVNKAMKVAKVQFYWKDDKGVERVACSSDAFAVRPDHYLLNVTPISPDTTLKAGKDFNITIEAIGAGTSGLVSNYQEKADVYKVDYNDTKAKIGNTNCKLGKLNTTPVKFINGVASFKANYDDVGKLDLTVHEVLGKEYALIDKDDTLDKTKRLISSASTSTSAIEPSTFKIQWDFTNGGTEYTYFSSDPQEMGANLDMNITALKQDNTPATNFNNGCYSEDITITAKYQGDPDIKYNPTMKASWEQNSTIKPLTNLPANLNNSDHFTYKIEKSLFTNAKGAKHLKINFERNTTTPRNPMLFTVNEINVTQGNITASSVKNKTLKFIYARAYAPDQQVAGKEIAAKIYYEVYCKECNKPKFGFENYKEGVDSIDWLILPSIDEKLDYDLPTGSGYPTPPSLPSLPGSVTAGYTDGIRFIQKQNHSLKIESEKTPLVTKVKYIPKSYLKFNLFNPNPQTQSFSLSFSLPPKKWAGKGAQGGTVDLNISSTAGYRKIDW